MNKLSEVIVGVPVTTWVPLTNYQQYTAVARAGDVSPRNGVTIQLRKATDSSGTGATNHGSAVTDDDRAEASLFAADIGDYTHVSATVTDQDSPNTVTSFAILSDPRFAALDYDGEPK